MRWNALCDCGTLGIVWDLHLRRGDSQSCGCLSREKRIERNTKHGMASTPEYGSWSSMLQRCENPRSAGYHNYGGRGIAVCGRWRHSPAAFLEDMGPRPGLEYSIERRDNNGNYEPTNCYWGTMADQSNNKRVSHKVTFRGETLTIAQWAKQLGLTYNCLSSRLERGWREEEALSLPTWPPWAKKRNP